MKQSQRNTFGKTFAPLSLVLSALGLISTAASADTVNAIYNSATDVPITASSYTATGNTVNFTLNCGLATGAELMVLKNTGLGFINGTFDNLTNGQPVTLSLGGTNYDFFVNYYGGDGNDLVLEWANQVPFGWGFNYFGQLGDNTVISPRRLPVLVNATSNLSALYNKAVVGIAAGYSHSLALCADGTVASWGANLSGQLGDGTATQRLLPVAVNSVSNLSTLYNQAVVGIAAGYSHSLALCSDGTVAAWGSGSYGVLGNGTGSGQCNFPVAVSTAAGVSALYGKTVVAIRAGNSHSLALCSDGTLAAWGNNSNGQLGDNTIVPRNVPVAVNTASGVSALYGKTVVAIAAGSTHSLALCSDGTLVAWGFNSNGQLGDGTTTQHNAPVAVNTNSGVSALYGKTVVAIAAGQFHSLALCSDGTLVAWGGNISGQLGDNTTIQRNVPVLVSTALGISALSGKTVTSITAGQSHSMALCSDGTAVAWGLNANGQLGDNTGTQRLAPVTVSRASLTPGQFFSGIASGSEATHTLALVSTSPAAAINLTGNGLSITNGETTPSLSDGTDFGSAAVDSGTVVCSFTIQNAGTSTLGLTGTLPVMVAGPSAGDFTVTQPPGSSVPPGAATTFQVTFTPHAAWLRSATLIISNTISGQNPYVVSIQGISLLSPPRTVDIAYNSAADVPIIITGGMTISNTLDFTLNCGLAPGAELMVVKNTTLNFINGNFDNLTNGQPVTLSFGGTNYNFVANYYGGSGRDLVLEWANQTPFAWGNNAYGQLGDNTILNRLTPVPVIAVASALANKTPLAFATGQNHSLALCSDGTVAAWGYNNSGQLGDNTTSQRYVPVAVNTASNVSALYGKFVAAIAVGGSHSLALCSDGTVAAWGLNGNGQLGDNSTSQRLAPVAVNTTTNVSALYGKTVVAIAAGTSHSLALCSDGTLAAWGYNHYGQLGDNTTVDCNVPTAVNTTSGVSALYGKTVVAIAAGAYHSLVLCSDGTLVAWGANGSGQLGDNTTTQRLVPAAVNTVSNVSALYGKLVVAVAAGSTNSLALCSDGTVAAWGLNGAGQLGDNTTTQRNAPVAVNTVSNLSALCGKSVVAIVGGASHSLALCSDGTLAAWGLNSSGQLGDNTTTQRNSPVLVNATTLAGGRVFAGIASGPNANFTLALVAAAPAPMLVVTGNGSNIRDGDTLPKLSNGTDFGAAVPATGTVAHTYSIQNIGTVSLNLTGTPEVAVSGANAADFIVTVQPAGWLPAGGTTAFQVTFTPGGPWLRVATLTIANDRSDQNPFVFDIQGTGAPGTVDVGWNAAADVPLRVGGFTATGSTVNLSLNFEPSPGTELTVVKNTAPGFINGTFDNLTNGQPVTLTYNGKAYNFVANYYGGGGRDLVLVWASSRVFAWGRSWYGDIGDGTTKDALLPTPVVTAGVLADKTVVALAASGGHSLALCPDGTLAAWGYNWCGQLGNNSTTNSTVPVAVNRDPGVSALYGKTVVAIAAGADHSVALCSDGTVATWGRNLYGQLGDTTWTNRSVPVAVNTAPGVSALYGKTVLAIAAGGDRCMALCSDGTVAAWGDNFYGEVGDNTTQNRCAPVAVSTTPGVSALYGKTVARIAAGWTHSLALCSDGTLVAWGNNGAGGLGDTTHTGRNAPVTVNSASGVSALYGKTVVDIAADWGHSLALCTDGMLAAWGANDYGEIGDGTAGYQNDRFAPVAVNTVSNISALFGKTITAISAGLAHSIALCSDGTLAAWGANDNGELGDGTTNRWYAPILVNSTPLATGQCFTRIPAGAIGAHTLAVVAAPQAVPTSLAGTQSMPDGTFQFGFTNTPGAFCGVLATSDLTQPRDNWTPLGDATEVSPGQFQFTDLQATNSPQRFYRVRSP